MNNLKIENILTLKRARLNRLKQKSNNSFGVIKKIEREIRNLSK